MEQKYAEYAVQKAAELLAIDSPTGFTDQAAAWVLDTFGALGFDAKKTAKGGVLVDLGGDASDEGALLLQAHTDTLGAMVAEVKANGRLRVTNLGGMRAENGETENVRVYTRAGKVYEGTLQLCNASVHVNGDYGKTDTAHFGGGAGAGVKVDPVAFLVVKDGLTRVMPVAIPAAATVDRVLDLVPEVLDRVQNFVDKKREEKDIY